MKQYYSISEIIETICKEKEIEYKSIHENKLINDAIKLGELITDLKNLRLKLRLKREALIFAMTEKKKEDDEELEKSISAVDSILASGILAERAGRSKNETRTR